LRGIVTVLVSMGGLVGIEVGHPRKMFWKDG